MIYIAPISKIESEACTTEIFCWKLDGSMHNVYLKSACYSQVR